MILSKEKEITINPSNFKHYGDLEYKNLKVGERITVPIHHIPKGSKIKIDVQCDICNTPKELSYCDYNNKFKLYNIYTCYKCKSFKIKLTNLKNHGVEFISQVPEINQKIKDSWDEKTEEEIKQISDKTKQTKLENYGDENYVNVEKCKQTKLERHGDENYNNPEKNKETCLEKWGVEFASQSEEFKEKLRRTWENKTREELDEINNKRIESCLNIYGTEYSQQSEDVKDKIKATTLKNHGVESSLSSPEIRAKGEETSIKKYGVKNPMQNSEIIEKCKKNSYKLKDYRLPSGQIIKVQGYENLALDMLFKSYNENDLLIKDKDIENHIGQIWYKDINGGNHRYLPDIYIISENKIIEVKSTWTYQKKKDSIFLKQQSCINMGMKFEFMIFNRKYTLLAEQEVKLLVI
ncbi:hypothetical protein COB55_04350 [Candidatus Wolfebacteria bacterium]|nr:MAG: hypothetical protein COB55_04350 [Candidatus Wolfebacteria bacterium]